MAMTKQEILIDLREKILAEYYSQGHALVERDLCEAYGVSRSPIREILWSLAVDGIVEQRPTRGFFVRVLDRDKVFEIFQLREAVEGMAARIACTRATQLQLATIQGLRDELSAIEIETRLVEGANLGRAMHRVVIDSCANELLKETYDRLWYLTVLASNIARRSVATERESRHYHLAIMDALLSKNEERAEQTMREHLRCTCRNVIAWLYPQARAAFDSRPAFTGAGRVQ